MNTASQNQLELTAMNMGGANGTSLGSVDDDFAKEIRALERHAGAVAQGAGEETHTIDLANISVEELSRFGWLASPEWVGEMDGEIDYLRGEMGKDRSEEDVAKLNQLADEFKGQFRNVQQLYARGRSADGAAALLEVKDRLQTLRRNAWFQTFMIHDQDNSLQRLIGEQQLTASQWSLKGAQADLETAKQDAARARSARKKSGFLTIIGLVVAIVATVMTVGGAAVAGAAAGAAGGAVAGGTTAVVAAGTAAGASAATAAAATAAATAVTAAGGTAAAAASAAAGVFASAATQSAVMAGISAAGAASRVVNAVA